MRHGFDRSSSGQGRQVAGSCECGDVHVLYRVSAGSLNKTFLQRHIPEDLTDRVATTANILPLFRSIFGCLIVHLNIVP